jgi:hypothetical protein
MLDAFKQLVESGVMTEETQSVIEAAFSKKIEENRYNNAYKKNKTKVCHF